MPHKRRGVMCTTPVAPVGWLGDGLSPGTVLCGRTLPHVSQYQGRGSLETRLTLKEGGDWSKTRGQGDMALGQPREDLLVGTKPSQFRVGGQNGTCSCRS